MNLIALVADYKSIFYLKNFLFFSKQDQLHNLNEIFLTIFLFLKVSVLLDILSIKNGEKKWNIIFFWIRYTGQNWSHLK